MELKLRFMVIDPRFRCASRYPYRPRIVRRGAPGPIAAPRDARRRTQG
jgi:hypothetical protein